MLRFLEFSQGRSRARKKMGYLESNLILRPSLHAPVPDVTENIHVAPFGSCFTPRDNGSCESSSQSLTCRPFLFSQGLGPCWIVYANSVIYGGGLGLCGVNLASEGIKD